MRHPHLPTLQGLLWFTESRAVDPGRKKYRRLKGHLGGEGEGSLVYDGSCQGIEGGERHSARWLFLSRGQYRLPQTCMYGWGEGNPWLKSTSGTGSQLNLTGGLNFLVMYVCYGCENNGWSCIHGGGCFLCFCHSFCMPILASRLLGTSLAFSGYRGALIAAWVSAWSKPYASTDFKKKKKKKNQ